MSIPRRESIKKLLALPLLGVSANHLFHENTIDNQQVQRLKSSLNGFSFNAPLMAGTMDIFGMMEFCAKLGFEGLDITGYYFKGYPLPPDHEYLYQIKRKAHEVGIEISGTGVRNDFTIPDKNTRAAEVQRVLAWIDTAARLGAPVLRIFAGQEKREGHTHAQIMDWMLEDIHRCVEAGKKNGVIIGLQNHNDFIQTAAHVTEFMTAIVSPWFGLILDTGSYRKEDPYEAIEKTIPYAVNWQIKEKIFVNGQEVDTDLGKLFNIIKKSSYQGYLPIETLGAGDPKVKVTNFYNKVMPYMK